MVSLHVLFADDDADIRAVVALSLKRDALFTLRSCASGAEALHAAREWRPDLALLDVSMPVLDGPAVLAHLHADRRTAAIPVVFLTGRVEGPERARWKALGAAGVIAKPFDPLALAGELRRFAHVEGALAAARENFLLRLSADAAALSECRRRLLRTDSKSVLARINGVAHALAGVGGIYGFAGISCEAAALVDAVEDHLAGRATCSAAIEALDRVLKRIGPAQNTAPASARLRVRNGARRYSAAAV